MVQESRREDQSQDSSSGDGGEQAREMLKEEKISRILYPLKV